MKYREINEFRGDVIEHLTEKNQISSINVKSLGNSKISKQVGLFLKNAFLPQGYPDSVSKDYFSYQLWDTIQAFASSISGTLATQAVLEGIGVGDEEATPLAATITWLLRHGSGMIGSIMFTWMQGSDLDHNCKKWRLFADFANDSAMCLELSGPLWPKEWFQYILCGASVSRALVGVAGGATRTAITQHQARAENISDVAAKDGSQETLVNLGALILNLSILPMVSGDPYLVWTLVVTMTMLHLFANYKAVTSLIFETLNKDRLLLILDAYCIKKSTKLPTPCEINIQESPFLGLGLKERQFCGKSINFGASLGYCCDKSQVHLAKIKQDLYANRFAILGSSDKSQVNVVLSDQIEPKNCLLAYATAFQHALEPLICFDTKDFEEKLKDSGWQTSHLQMSTLGWKGNFV